MVPAIAPSWGHRRAALYGHMVKKRAAAFASAALCASACALLPYCTGVGMPALKV